MLPSKRDKIQELLNGLRARSQSSEVADMILLLKLKLEGAKDDLVRCAPTEFMATQAEAKAYDKLIRDLTRSNPLDAKE